LLRGERIVVNPDLHDLVAIWHPAAREAIDDEAVIVVIATTTVIGCRAGQIAKIFPEFIRVRRQIAVGGRIHNRAQSIPLDRIQKLRSGKEKLIRQCTVQYLGLAFSLLQQASCFALINVMQIADLSFLVKRERRSVHSVEKFLEPIHTLFEKYDTGFCRVWDLL
jgi:hypothetical protein